MNITIAMVIVITVTITITPHHHYYYHDHDYDHHHHQEQQQQQLLDDAEGEVASSPIELRKSVRAAAISNSSNNTKAKSFTPLLGQKQKLPLHLYRDKSKTTFIILFKHENSEHDTAKPEISEK